MYSQELLPFLLITSFKLKIHLWPHNSVLLLSCWTMVQKYIYPCLLRRAFGFRTHSNSFEPKSSMKFADRPLNEIELMHKKYSITFDFRTQLNAEEFDWVITDKFRPARSSQCRVWETNVAPSLGLMIHRGLCFFRLLVRHWPRGREHTAQGPGKENDEFVRSLSVIRFRRIAVARDCHEGEYVTCERVKNARGRSFFLE